MEVSLSPRMLVVCHDAGGAEVVSSWIRRHGTGWDFAYLLAGPAQEIFEWKLRLDRSKTSGPSLDFVLCGSSGESPWEQTAVATAQAMGIPCAVYLDHWKNYRERFRTAMPDEIWVCDVHAEALASEEFPAAKILDRGNPYLQDFAEEVGWLTEERKREESKGRERVLWVDEPGCIEGFRRYVKTLRDAEILLRLHPSVAVGDYAPLLAAYAGVCDVDLAPRGRSLAESVAWADTVAGCDSMALVAALVAGKRVVSALPREEASIPYPEIERLA